jgi:hypothetical protein
MANIWTKSSSDQDRLERQEEIEKKERRAEK